jgi:hypothetical protein
LIFVKNLALNMPPGRAPMFQKREVGHVRCALLMLLRFASDADYKSAWTGITKMGTPQITRIPMSGSYVVSAT